MCAAQGSISDPGSKTTFPAQITVGEGEEAVELKATGASTRKKFFVKVYSIAHYMEKPPSGGQVFQEIVKADQPKQFTMQWLRNVSSKKIRDGYEDTFRKTLGGRYNSMQSQINQFNGFFSSNAKKGDKHVIRWIPGGTVEVEINGRKAGEIKNLQFAEALWSFWFGPKSVVKRNQLVSQIR